MNEIKYPNKPNKLQLSLTNGGNLAAMSRVLQISQMPNTMASSIWAEVRFMLWLNRVSSFSTESYLPVISFTFCTIFLALPDLS